MPKQAKFWTGCDSGKAMTWRKYVIVDGWETKRASLNHFADQRIKYREKMWEIRHFAALFPAFSAIVRLGGSTFFLDVMSMKFTPIIAAAALAVLPTIGSSATVLNGSFESDPGVKSQGSNGGPHGRGRTFGTMPVSGSSWGIWNDGVEGWDTANRGVEFQTQRTLGLKPADGLYYVELDTRRNSTITQQIFLTAGTYELSFAYSPRTTRPNDNGVSYSIAGLSGTITGPSASVPRREWTYVTGLFTVAADDVFGLSFSATGKSNSLGGFIDDVTISSVPVPAGLLLMGTALAGLGALRRKRG